MILAAGLVAVGTVALATADRVRAGRKMRAAIVAARKPGPDLEGPALIGAALGVVGANLAVAPIQVFNLVTLNPVGFILTADAATLAGGSAGAYAGASLAKGRPLTQAEAVAAIKSPADASLAMLRAFQGLVL